MRPAARYQHVWLFVVCFIFLAEPCLFSAPLMIEDVAKQRDIDHSDTQTLYQKLMGNQSAISPYAKYLRPPTQGATSLSLTAEWHTLEATSVKAKAITSLVWNQVRKELRQGVRKYFEQETDLPVISSGLVKPTESLKGESKGNRIVPKFKFGSDYVKPTLHIENPFHIDFSTDISYHTGKQLLEASLAKELSETFELSIKQANYFDEEERHDWLFGIQYEF